MTLVKEDILRAIGRNLPGALRPLAKKVYYRDRHRTHSALKGFGTVQDLYYWVADGNLDTLLLLQNYFSALYPQLDTRSDGTVTVYSQQGKPLGAVPFSLAHCGGAKMRVSSLLDELGGASRADSFGTLEVNIVIPQDVLDHIQDQKTLYFWDRFYMGYVNGQGQTCFVHGIDKTHIYRAGRSKGVEWYGKSKDRQWAPEIPVNIEEYKRFNVILINRTPRTAKTILTLSDINDSSLSWSAEIPSKGVRRFELTKENTAGLVPQDLRMRVKGMATQYGRPVVFKEFANGAISAMHC